MGAGTFFCPYSSCTSSSGCHCFVLLVSAITAELLCFALFLCVCKALEWLQLKLLLFSVQLLSISAVYVLLISKCFEGLFFRFISALTFCSCKVFLPSLSHHKTPVPQPTPHPAFPWSRALLCCLERGDAALPLVQGCFQ